ncbi:MAG: FlgD immunoglobulin-like domain containing protein, partial [Candidatus Latescibacterota bacterium]
ATALPPALMLSRAYPNPFNATVQLGSQVPGPLPTEVTLRVHDLLGQTVRTLVDGPAAPGRYSFSWDGRNEAGRPVATGTYLVVLRTASARSMQKVLLLR